jgi:hypothetical protein
MRIKDIFSLGYGRYDDSYESGWRGWGHGWGGWGGHGWGGWGGWGRC